MLEIGAVLWFWIVPTTDTLFPQISAGRRAGGGQPTGSCPPLWVGTLHAGPVPFSFFSNSFRPTKGIGFAARSRISRLRRGRKTSTIVLLFFLFSPRGVDLQSIPDARKLSHHHDTRAAPVLLELTLNRWPTLRAKTAGKPRVEGALRQFSDE